MKQKIPLLIISSILLAFVAVLFLLFTRSQKTQEEIRTVQPKVTDITRKTVVSGSVVPREEIELKPKISGILSSLTVEAGDVVKKNQPIGTVEVIPNAVNLNAAQARVQAARISSQNAKKEYARHQSLFEKNVISETELSRYQVEYELRRQELAAANSNLQVIKKGASKGTGATNEVISTIAGTILFVPVKIGTSVIEANNFNPGTTIATVADMTDLIFEGTVDEAEVGRLKTGLPIHIRVGALDNQSFDGTLEYIAPKGTVTEGVIQFTVRAKLTVPPDTQIRAGYSANADIVLDERKNVLAISESALLFEDKKTFVERKTQNGFEKVPVKLGISDGIHAEVLEGLSESDVCKQQN